MTKNNVVKKQHNFNPDTRAVVMLKNKDGTVEQINCLLGEVNDVIKGKKWIKFYAV